LKVPKTDLEMIWPLFWKHRGGFFAGHCKAGGDEKNLWVLEESRPAAQS